MRTFMAKRPSKDEIWSVVAAVISMSGTCARLKVGCVLVDNHGRVCGTGYNGPASGLPNCIEHPCEGACVGVGKGTGTCDALHAEQNALITCKFPFEIDTCYVSTAPCRDCLKMLMGTSCKRIVFLDEYQHDKARDLWVSMGREWVQLKSPWAAMLSFILQNARYGSPEVDALIALLHEGEGEG